MTAMKANHEFSEGGSIFRGLDKQYLKKLSHEVIRVDLVIHLNKINGILDIQSNIILIPKAGISTDIRSVVDGIANLHSRDYGRLFIDNKELEDSNCMAEIISFNDGIIYTSKQSEIPSTALIKFNKSLERVATFPLLQKENICNYQC